MDHDGINTPVANLIVLCIHIVQHMYNDIVTKIVNGVNPPPPLIDVSYSWLITRGLCVSPVACNKEKGSSSQNVKRKKRITQKKAQSDNQPSR